MSNRAQDFKELLDGFAAVYSEASKAELVDVENTLQAFKVFLPAHRAAVERWRKNQEDKADDFNLLEVMSLTGKEIRHSMILAWLLDNDIAGVGTHAQGNRGFRLFLEEVGLPIMYAEEEYRVRREVSSDESRVDIEVAARAKFIIHIENKIWAREGDSQLDREWCDLERRALALKCPQWHAFFLTPDRRSPVNPNFHPISWRQIANVLDKIRRRHRCSHDGAGATRSPPVFLPLCKGASETH